jgi:hypothetical protein
MKTRTLLPVPVEDEIENFFDAYGVLHELVNVVEFVAAGSSGAGVVIGNYGFGKTHVLLHLSSHVRKRYVKSFSIYVDTPGVSDLNFYNAVMGALLEDEDAGRAGGISCGGASRKASEDCWERLRGF